MLSFFFEMSIRHGMSVGEGCLLFFFEMDRIRFGDVFCWCVMCVKGFVFRGLVSSLKKDDVYGQKSQ